MILQLPPQAISKLSSSFISNNKRIDRAINAQVGLLNHPVLVVYVILCTVDEKRQNKVVLQSTHSSSMFSVLLHGSVDLNVVQLLPVIVL